ncbi:MAG: phage tail protein, partial [Alphaproteobacteria bacterium]|nr:phage tail protein [Alphaproteobacteria bacterium]
GNYCQAAQLAMSLLLDKQQPAARWLEEVALLTSAAIVWSGNLLKIVPYGDTALSANGMSWSPNLTWQYSLGDGDFLRWAGSDSTSDNSTDPVLLTRSDPAQATNWLSLEYMDNVNSYNPQLVAVFDQGLIDQYGLRSEPPVQAHEFTNPTSATVSAQLLLQRKAYVRNTYKFKLGWRYALLEPMDIVLLSDSTLGLVNKPVRITAIEEDDNGELTITAEEIPELTP